MTAIGDVSFEMVAGEVQGNEADAGKSVTKSALIGLIEPLGRIAGTEIHQEFLITMAIAGVTAAAVARQAARPCWKM